MPTRPIRALVVGAGETSTLMHLPVLARLQGLGRLELVEVCDLRRDRADAAQRRFGFRRAGGDGLSALQREDVDAVWLFGDAHLHHRYGLQALQAGKHLFVEKPISPGYAEACALAEAAAAGGLIAAGGHNRRFYRSLAEIRARGGRAGWRYAEAVFHKPASQGPPPFGARSWLTANGIHALDALVFLMGGLPEHLATCAASERFSALMRWPGGAQGVFLSDNQSGAREERYAVHAAGLSCMADDQGLRIEAGSASSFLELPAVGDGIEAEHAAFLDAIETGRSPAHAIEALAPSLRLAELIEEGVSGPLQAPKPRVAPVAPAPAAEARAAMVVLNPAGLKAALALHPPRRPLVALEDLLRSSAPRPDIQAALLGPGPERLTPEALDRLPDLKVVGLVGLSFARAGPDLLLQRGVTLVNASAAYADSAAEFALGLAILARRRAFGSAGAMRRGGWGLAPAPSGWRGAALGAARAVRPAAVRTGLEPALLKLWRRSAPLHGIAEALPTPSRELRGAVVGLVGWGANARAFAARLLAAGAHVLAWSEQAPAEEIAAAGARPAALADVLAAEIVSLHRGLTPATRHFLGPAELARLRPGAILINVARGALVEPGALLARLKRGDVFACLDSFGDEPPPPSDPLRRLPNVFLTSHIAGGSPDMQAAAAEEVLGKIDACLGGAPVQAVTLQRLRVMT